MKKILCLCMVAVLLVAFAGCEKTANNVNGAQASQNAGDPNRGKNPALNTSNDPTIQENPEATKNGYPPLPENLQVMYQGAEEMSRAFTLCAFQVDSSKTVTINGMEYQPIVDQRFPTYAKLQEYLAQYFTKEYIVTQLLTPNGCVQQGPGGEAAMIAASGTDDMTYAGHVFQVTTKNDQTIAFTATVYFASDVYMEGYFFTHPANAGDFTTKDYNFQLDYTENGWRYSKFAYLRG